VTEGGGPLYLNVSWTICCSFFSKCFSFPFMRKVFFRLPNAILNQINIFIKISMFNYMFSEILDIIKKQIFFFENCISSLSLPNFSVPFLVSGQKEKLMRSICKHKKTLVYRNSFQIVITALPCRSHHDQAEAPTFVNDRNQLDGCNCRISAICTSWFCPPDDPQQVRNLEFRN
jgi:hypothetical protein